MIELVFIGKNILSHYFILNISLDAIFWNVFLLLFFIGVIFGSILLYFHSKNPMDWKHESLFEGHTTAGRLHDLAESMELNIIDAWFDAPIQRLLRSIFFDKFRSVKGVSLNELINLQTRDNARLRQIIGDAELAEWIVNGSAHKKGINYSFFQKDSIDKKEKNLKELNHILEKMETWG